ncbi:MAG: ABC transporter permease [Lysobacterales bacterium]|nr:ABC transporter permease [Xanthomonadales bacterium]MCB1612755.1 ABC transporter permease [Xanthomonadales bacterium]MCP5473683.1 ABC transporter permease [Rhodanobacteraceae bacterium]
MAQADYSLDQTEGKPVLRLRGDWTVAGLPAAERRSQGLSAATGSRPVQVDASELTALDTAGALLLVQRWLGNMPWPEFQGLRPADGELLSLVGERIAQPRTRPRKPFGIQPMLERTGAAVEFAWRQFTLLLGFGGQTLTTILAILAGRQRLRWTSAVHHMERAGLDAVPIVCLLSFLVGAVVAFLGATVLADFGAQVFTVELVSFSFMREFGVLLTAIMIAGRSGSAYTAEIGMMRAREEIDAIRALGLDPVELLVVPRLLALLVMLPVLSFLAVLSGILGGALVGGTELGISPGLFLARMQETAELRHLLVGLSKAPLFAVIIALVGCLEGLKVQGSAESVGRHTTSSVVQSIFLVILVDAIAAIFFMELGW